MIVSRSIPVSRSSLMLSTIKKFLTELCSLDVEKFQLIAVFVHFFFFLQMFQLFAVFIQFLHRRRGGGIKVLETSCVYNKVTVCVSETLDWYFFQYSYITSQLFSCEIIHNVTIYTIKSRTRTNLIYQSYSFFWNVSITSRIPLYRGKSRPCVFLLGLERRNFRVRMQGDGDIPI